MCCGLDWDVGSKFDACCGKTLPRHYHAIWCVASSSVANVARRQITVHCALARHLSEGIVFFGRRCQEKNRDFCLSASEGVSDLCGWFRFRATSGAASLLFTLLCWCCANQSSNDGWQIAKKYVPSIVRTFWWYATS